MTTLADAIARFRLSEDRNAAYDNGYSDARRGVEPDLAGIRDPESYLRGWKAGSKRRIALYGGTFNPIHKGHLAVAKEAKKVLGLDKVTLIPSAQPPHKPGREVASATDRLTMTKLAVGDDPDLEVSDIEHRREGPSYTIDTVKAFKAENPDSELFFVIGSDSVPFLNKWKDIDELKKLVTFAVASRGERDFEQDLANNVAGVKLVRIPMENPSAVSSTKVRELAAAGQGLEDLPEPVAIYVQKAGLYGTKKTESLYARLCGPVLFDSALVDLNTCH